MTKPTSRRLAAIMFTDIVGYTALMGSNESKTMHLLDINRSIHTDLIHFFGGRLLKEMGDGIMASFPNTYNAVMCAAAIQKKSKEKGYSLRVGLHEGEIIEQEGDIFGDGVNVASRVESAAKPGQILGTQFIQNNLTNKAGISYEFVGKKNLKNVSKLIGLYVITVEENTLKNAIKEQKIQLKESQKKTIHSILKWLIIGFIGAGTGAILWSTLGYGVSVEGFKPQEVWKLRNESIMVFPFEGPKDDLLTQFGEMGCYWISKSLTEVTEGKVIDPGSFKNYADIPQDFIERTGLDLAVVGKYFLMDKEENNLELFVDLVDVVTLEKRSLGHFIGSSSNPEAVLEEVAQKLMAIWALDGKIRWADNPPRYDAYKEYQTAHEIWSTDYEKAIEGLSKAYELDTTFYEALLKMSVAYTNLKKYIGRFYSKLHGKQEVKYGYLVTIKTCSYRSKP